MRVTVFALGMAIIGYEAPAYAQDTTQTPTTVEKPISISVTPRLWYQTAVSGNTYHSAAAHQLTVDTTRYVQYGLSVEVFTRNLPDWSFILTGYYGETSAPARALDYFPSTSPTLSNVAEDIESSSLARYDIEFLSRYLMSPTLSVTGGFRIIHDTDKIRNDQITIFPNTARRNISSGFVTKNDSSAYLAEIGFLSNTPISASGRHILFGGATLGLGANTFNQSRLGARASALFFAATVDVYAGYQFQLTQSIALNARYRAIMLGSGSKPLGDINVFHGPEIGVTTRF